MTYVSDYYQVTPMEDGGFEATLGSSRETRITYNPDDKIKPWHKQVSGIFRDFHTYSQNITGLELTKYELKILHYALTAVGKQDLMDNEIVFVGKK